MRKTSSFLLMKGMKNMFEFLQGKKTIDIYKAAEILKTNPELLQDFEKAYANSNISGEMSDNFFDIAANEPYEITFRSEKTVEELSDALTVLSVYDIGM